jgi:ABC-type glycerol-3-phosphate transport system permease component
MHDIQPHKANGTGGMKMRYFTLGRTGLRVSRTGFGALPIQRVTFEEAGALLNRALDLFSRFLAGMPVVVLLMVFYYIVFSGMNVNGVIVSVLVFSLLFAFSVFGLLQSGAASVAKGQTEAALALGFSERQAFRKFVLPQAILTFFPTYQSEIISLLTRVVFTQEAEVYTTLVKKDIVMILFIPLPKSRVHNLLWDIDSQRLPCKR